MSCFNPEGQFPTRRFVVFCHGRLWRSYLTVWLVAFGTALGALAQSNSLEAPASKLLPDEPPVSQDDREHWSLLPIDDPAIPAAGEWANWAKSPIDAFVLRRLRLDGHRPAPPATRSQLMRRLKFDLLGLPPTREELLDFERDRDPNAYARLVDRWLASPAYGERWAQYWLDLARFAETDGFEHDKTRAEAWRYRDWVVQSLNADMPYDRFLRYQLCGDLLDDSAAVATMFCLAGPDMPDINEQDLRRHDRLNEITSTVGAVCLGFQFHCAQCHDHKYDPISQADFYRLRAIFSSAVPVMKRDRPVLQLAHHDDTPSPRLFHRGELRHAGPAVKPGLPRLAVPAGEDWTCDGPQPRLEFADWLAADSNPLTARVMANRVWQFHFGLSLTENPSDFGIIVDGPSHPELLDWLASQLRYRRWSLKEMHRAIVLSATYRQASAQSIEAGTVYSGFPRRRLQGEVVRDALLSVSGQLNRHMAGPSVLPPLPPEMVKTLLKGQWKTSSARRDHVRRSIYTFCRRNLRFPIFDVFDRPDAGASCACRDQTTTALQSLQMLNSPLTIECASRFAEKLIRQHAMEQAFDRRPEERSREKTKRPPADWEKLVESLFWDALGRPPDTLESQTFTQFLKSAQTPRTGLETACVAIFNCNEFLYVD